MNLDDQFLKNEKLLQHTQHATDNLNSSRTIDKLDFCKVKSSGKKKSCNNDVCSQVGARNIEGNTL